MSPYYAENGVEIYNADVRDALPEMHGKGIDLIVADPPYMNIGSGSTMKAQGKSNGFAELMNFAHFVGWWWGECRKIMRGKPSALWCFTSWRCSPAIMRASFDCGWPISSILVWNKDMPGPGMDCALRPSYELVALLAQNGFRIPNRSTRDIWKCQWQTGGGKTETTHGAEKPVDLLYRIIKESTDDDAGQNGAVLDPFGGSGSTMLAAQRAGRKGIMIEIDEAWCEVAAKRVAQAALVV